MNLGIMKNLETTLKRFEEWQKDMNPGDDDHPNHHDLAILLTRYIDQNTKGLIIT